MTENWYECILVILSSNPENMFSFSQELQKKWSCQLISIAVKLVMVCMSNCREENKRFIKVESVLTRE